MSKHRLMIWVLGFTLFGGGWAWSADKKPLGAGVFSLVKNSVTLTDQAGKKTANKDDKISTGNQVDTGATAFTEMTFDDSSVLRLGENSHFSFSSQERLIQGSQGTMLMHAPPGNGGISIESGGVVGAVSGSTVMVSLDGKGNFTFAVLETAGGSGTVTHPDGTVTTVPAGHAAVIPANSPPSATRVVEMNVTAIMESSPLYREAAKDMPGTEKVSETAEKQAKDIEAGVKVLELAPPIDEKASRPEDVAIKTLAALTGLSAEECALVPNLVLKPASEAGRQATELGTVFSMNTDAGGEVSARVASGTAEFVPTGSTSGVKIGSNQGFSSSTGQVAALAPTDSFAGVMIAASDARAPEGQIVAAGSAQPSSGGPADVATAAGTEGRPAPAASTQSPLPPVGSPSSAPFTTSF